VSVGTIDLPIVLGGRAIWPDERAEWYELEYDSGAVLRFPKPAAADIEAILSCDRHVLHDMHFQEIIAFLRRVGLFWDPANAGHGLYRDVVSMLAAVHGYSEKMARRELNIMASLLRSHTAWHDLLDAELYNRFYLEEWLPHGDALIHAQPHGVAVHVLVGNVPVSGVVSVARGAVTKNVTVAKLPRRDPITTLFFARACIELDAQHPLTRSLNIVYWPGGDPIGDQLLHFGDVVAVWGSGEATRDVRAKTRPGVDVLEFGPRTSFALVGRESADSPRVGVDVAHDVAMYNQEACFSPQVVFVEGDDDAFVERLEAGLRLYERLLPKMNRSIDVHAHVSRSRLEAHYNGNRVVASDAGTEWTIVKIADLTEINEHPLSRTIYVKPVESLAECVEFVDENTQTVTISPWERNAEIRDLVTLRGATKITDVGLVETSRVGTTHDGMFPMHRLVRWVCVERGRDYWGKYVRQGPLDTTQWLMMHERELEHYET
jgi:long-chain-fatty-acyl-CoA reductase